MSREYVILPYLMFSSEIPSLTLSPARTFRIETAPTSENWHVTVRDWLVYDNIRSCSLVVDYVRNTLRLGRGEWLIHVSAALFPGKDPMVPIA